MRKINSDNPMDASQVGDVPFRERVGSGSVGREATVALALEIQLYC